MKLRPYQIEARRAVYERFKAGESALLVMATGTGKTFTGMSMAVDALHRGGRVLWLGHRTELVDQPRRTLCGDKAPPEWREAWESKVGTVKGSRDRVGAQCIFASAQTLWRVTRYERCADCGRTIKAPAEGPCECGAARWETIEALPRLEKVLAKGAIRLLVVDEAHHSASPGWQRVISRVVEHAREQGTECLVLGLTATPERTDKLRLSDTWGEEPAFFFPIERAIDEGYLLPPVFDRQLLKLDRAKFEKMDDQEAAQELVNAGAVAHCVKSMEPYRGKRTALVFVPSVDLAEKLCDELRTARWRAAWVCGDSDPADRARIVRRLGEGGLDCVVNVGVLTEGTDIPRCDLAVLLRPCKSKPLYIQIVGRVLRLFGEQSDAVVLDLTGASLEHSLTQAPVIVEPEIIPPEEDPDSTEYRPPNQREALRELGGLAALKRREPIQPAWAEVLYVEGDWLACDCGGDMGLVLVGPVGDGWGAWWHKKRRRKPPIQLHEDGRPVSLVDAQNLGADVFRRACPSADRRANERNEPPTSAQRKAVHFDQLQLRARNDWGQWVLWDPGVIPPRATRGDVEDAMASRWAREVIERHQLAVVLPTPESKRTRRAS